MNKLNEKIYPTELSLLISETGLPKNSVLMLQQIRTTSEITDSNIKQRINLAISNYFEL